MNVKLVVQKGSDKDQIFTLRNRTTVIGRMHGCDLRIPSSKVSRHHCRLRLKDKTVTLEDLDSSNGTLVNGKKVKQKVLRAGDLIQIGPIVFLVQISASTPVVQELEEPQNIDQNATLDEKLIIPGQEEATFDLVENPPALESERPFSSPWQDISESPPLTEPVIPSKKSKSGKKAKKEMKDKDTSPAMESLPENPEEKPAAKEDEQGPNASLILGEKGWKSSENQDLRDIFSQLEDE